VNPATLRVLGYSQEELLDKSVLELIHPDDVDRVLSKLKESLSAGEGQDEFRYLKKDGSYIWLEGTGTVVPHEIEEASLIIISRDITARKQAETALQKSYDEMEMKVQERTLQLKERTAQLQSEITEQERTEQALRESENYYRTIFENTGTAMMVIEEDITMSLVNTEAEKLFGCSREELEGRKKWSEFVAKDELERLKEHHRLRRMDPASVPKVSEFNFINKQGAVRNISMSVAIIPGTKKSVASLLDVTKLKQAGVERDKSAQELKKSLEKMKRILVQVVTSLGTTLEIRDPYTAGHQIKVAKLATAIAEEMGFSKEQIEGIAVAGNLHDIGKINVPSEILSKPGKITDIEFSIIKTHCQAGYEIVKDIEFPWPVAEIMLQHHERMDGSGYPWGLTGDEILMEARILAVADVVEAMSSHRPYRPSLGIDLALEEISLSKGIRYDPTVADICLRLFQEKGFKFK
ncbi:MAG TPA: PAS domain S-box protein, partial [Syntrophomonas sp.]|nr:PAS domain S-box protein [Syntrophomonas sp.]